ncbi:MAG: hypothetical protein QOF55_919 [Thermoleophilaceae bacterium]|nr:hypothetical protein [Thermoleophilaceae bacterium]MEA2421820.1 hypothetical protein [Thermoleophilaceae bacterium]
MQSVPAPFGLSGRRAAAAALVAALLAAAAIAAVLLAAPGPAAAPARPASHVYDGLIGGVPLQSARCVQWSAGTAAERDKVAAALSYSVGGATPYGNGTTLSSSQAHTLFDNACASPIAQHWLLYELYIRAAGFHRYLPR